MIVKWLALYSVLSVLAIGGFFLIGSLLCDVFDRFSELTRLGKVLYIWVSTIILSSLIVAAWYVYQLFDYFSGG